MRRWEKRKTTCSHSTRTDSISQQRAPITNERDFSGEPVVALVVSVEDGAADAQPQPADEA